ncbi:MAG: YceI family protein [Ardenticatenales bacterium]|nr:YceI family protein [Ardenticatenales bacterium]
MTIRRFTWAAGTALLIAAGACAPNPADDAPAAQVSSGPTVVAPSANPEVALVAPVEEAAPDVAAAAVDGAAPVGVVALSGSIGFVASKITRTHDCVFSTWDGTLDPGDGTVATAKLSFTVDVNTVGCDATAGGNERLEKHLRSDSFFDVETHPAATFVSTAIVEGGEAGATHTVTGDLTIRGIARQVSFPATVEVAEKTVKAKAEFSVNRQDWEIRYPGQPDDLVRDNVLIKIDLAGEA